LEADPVQFRAYVAKNGPKPTADYLDGMVVLFGQIENLGITGSQFANVRRALFAGVVPRGKDVAWLDAVIHAAKAPLSSSSPKLGPGHGH
jgi:hypothetical protein